MMDLKKTIKIIFLAAYLIFIISSFLMNFEPGKEIGNNFAGFLGEMVNVLPCAFILIGLFEVWVKKESVEKHLGNDSGILGFLWMILLSGTTVGGLYVAFPVAQSLYKKGARLSLVFTYISCSGVCRIPMIIFEASFVGIKFTIIRILISLPLVILSSILLGNYFDRKNDKMPM